MEHRVSGKFLTERHARKIVSTLFRNRKTRSRMALSRLTSIKMPIRQVFPENAAADTWNAFAFAHWSPHPGCGRGKPTKPDRDGEEHSERNHR